MIFSASPKAGSRDNDGNSTLTQGFDILIERAAMLLVAGSTSDTDEDLALQLYRQANDCIIEAAHSPFFGGVKSSVSYDGLDIVRELVFERVRYELSRRGYPILDR